MLATMYSAVDGEIFTLVKFFVAELKQRKLKTQEQTTVDAQIFKG